MVRKNIFTEYTLTLFHSLICNISIVMSKPTQEAADAITKNEHPSKLVFNFLFEGQFSSENNCRLFFLLPLASRLAMCLLSK